jgi:dienelactone hydrolase
MKKLFIPATISFCMLFSLFGTVRAQSAEKVTFSTFTPTGHTNLLLGSGSRSEIKADAMLTLPNSTQGRQPVIVIVPGAGGQVEEHLAFWRSRILAAGIGVVAVDPLRIRNLAPDQSERLTLAADLVDTLRLLKALTAHPLVDRDRIGILGFSRGGLIAWDSQAEAFTTAALGASSGVRFVAHAALYPPCHYAHIERRSVQVPALLVLAGADARTPPEQCQSLVKAASTRGYSTQVTVVEGAQHAFDYFLPAFLDANGFSSKGCRPLVVDTAAPYPRPVYLDDGSPLVTGDGPAPVPQILEWSRQCRKPTPALTGNQKASEREEAASAVVAFFVSTLKP